MFCAASAIFEPASSCAAAASATAAGATRTSRSRPSAAAAESSSARRARIRWRASFGVRFIFQLPASIFLRIALSPLVRLIGLEVVKTARTLLGAGLERLDARQLDAFQVLQRCSAAGRNMAEARRPRLVGERRGGVAAADNAEHAIPVS